MRQIFLDTETTGLNPAMGHRLIEIAAVEMIDRKLTRRHYHCYINPEREIDAEAERVHGISLDFLLDKPKFAAVADEFLRFVEGGETRQQSVENALATLAADTALVAVHDAVRPFVTVAAIEKVIEQAAQTGAAILGIVPVDTVKQVHLNRIRATIPRDRLVLAQTPPGIRPQAAHTNILLCFQFE